MKSTSLVAQYSIDENYSFFGGVNRYALEDGTVTTLAGHYEVEQPIKQLEYWEQRMNAQI